MCVFFKGFGGYGAAETGNTQKVLNFNKYKGVKNSKYLYFSAPTGLVQADSVQELCYRWVRLIILDVVYNVRE